MCFWAGAKNTGLYVLKTVQRNGLWFFGQVYKAPAYVFVNWCEGDWLMCSWAGEKVAGLYVC